MEHVNDVAFLVEESEMASELSASNADVDVVVVSSAGFERGGKFVEEHVTAFG